MQVLGWVESRNPRSGTGVGSTLECCWKEVLLNYASRPYNPWLISLHEYWWQNLVLRRHMKVQFIFLYLEPNTMPSKEFQLLFVRLNRIPKHLSSLKLLYQTCFNDKSIRLRPRKLGFKDCPGTFGEVFYLSDSSLTCNPILPNFKGFFKGETWKDTYESSYIFLNIIEILRYFLLLFICY